MAPELPGESRSYWLESTPATDFPQLDEDITVDVAVIGAGIAGISTAYFLDQDGFDVAVLDASRVVDRVTGHTTAKLTANHGLIYRKLIDTFGEEQARLYADANQTAIDQVTELVESLNIDCDFRRTRAYTYAVNESGIDDIQDEIDAAQRLGLPAGYTNDIPLPVDAAAAVQFRNQAQFHPRKYLLALLDEITNGDSAVYEQTRATGIASGNPHTVKTGNGSVTADHVVLATHFPFRDTGLYFTRLYPHYSYLLGAYLHGDIPEGMYYSTEESFHSFRPQPTPDGEMLLISGQPHRTGNGGDTRERYRQLAQYARDTFDIAEIRYRWSTQDYGTPDRVPYIGRVSPVADRIYVGTGFRGWGMAHGTVTGILLTDLIAGRENEWHDLYTPNRVGPASSWPTFLEENLQNMKRLVGGRFRTERQETLAGINRGEGKVVKIDGDHVAVYRDEDGALHEVSAVCTHMGCIVSWNGAEKTWDCGCHGSRFTYDGEPIDGPAQEGLAEKDVEQE